MDTKSCEKICGSFVYSCMNLKSKTFVDKYSKKFESAIKYVENLPKYIESCTWVKSVKILIIIRQLSIYHRIFR